MKSLNNLQKKIFLSYSSRNNKAVLRIENHLRNWGFDVWIDQYDIKPGSNWEKSLEKAVLGTDVLLLVVSKGAAESAWVEWELNTALKENKLVIPLILEHVKFQEPMTSTLGKLQAISLRNGREAGLNKLIEALGGTHGNSPLFPGVEASPYIRKNSRLISVLLHYFQDVTNGGSVIFSGGKNFSKYIQIMVIEDSLEVYVECIGNKNLPAGEKLNEQEISYLVDTGWKKPSKTSSGNFYKSWNSRVDNDRIVISGEIMLVFLNVLGHPPGEKLDIEILNVF